MRLNVHVPDELAALVKSQLPGLNVSALLQDALRARLDCDHHALACATCGTEISRREIVDAALSHFYGEIMWQLIGPVSRCATAEGAGRVVKSIAEGLGVTAVKTMPVPRATRSQRARHQAEILADALDDTAQSPTPRRRRSAA